MNSLAKVWNSMGNSCEFLQLSITLAPVVVLVKARENFPSDVGFKDGNGNIFAFGGGSGSGQKTAAAARIE